MVLTPQDLTLYIIIGTLAAIVYALRVLILLERRIAKMDENIEKLTGKVLKEELKIERKITKKKTRIRLRKRRKSRRHQKSLPLLGGSLI